MADHRKLLQFSLRTALVLLTISCVWLGWKVERAREQREAVNAIEMLGGVVQCDWQQIKPSPEQPPGPAWLRRMIGDEFFQEPVSVWFSGTGRPEEQVVEGILDADPYPQRLRRLNSADASTARIEKAIPSLKRLRRLKSVFISLKFSNEAKTMLAAALPGCEVVYAWGPDFPVG